MPRRSDDTSRLALHILLQRARTTVELLTMDEKGLSDDE